MGGRRADACHQQVIALSKPFICAAVWANSRFGPQFIVPACHSPPMCLGLHRLLWGVVLWCSSTGKLSSSPGAVPHVPVLFLGSLSTRRAHCAVSLGWCTSLIHSSWGTWVVPDFVIVLQFDTICSWPSVPTHTENINTVIFHLPRNLSWFPQLAALYVHARSSYIAWLKSSNYLKAWASCWTRLMLGVRIHLGLSTDPRIWDGNCHGDKAKISPVIFLKRRWSALPPAPTHEELGEKFLSGLCCWCSQLWWNCQECTSSRWCNSGSWVLTTVRYCSQKWGKHGFATVWGGGVCSQHSAGNLYYSVLCMERVKLAFPQFVQSWCLKEFENPILSCQLISLTMKIPQLLCVAWQTILSFFFNNISFFT